MYTSIIQQRTKSINCVILANFEYIKLSPKFKENSRFVCSQKRKRNLYLNNSIKRSSCVFSNGNFIVFSNNADAKKTENKRNNVILDPEFIKNKFTELPNHCS